MPRKNHNARTISQRELSVIRKPRAVLIWPRKIKDDISPGRLVAAAEWR